MTNKEQQIARMKELGELLRNASKAYYAEDRNVRFYLPRSGFSTLLQYDPVLLHPKIQMGGIFCIMRYKTS